MKSVTRVQSSKTSPTPISSTDHGKVNKHWHKALEKAVAHNEANPQRKSFQISYHKKSTGRIVKRKIDPLKITGTLMVAYDHKRDGIRSFHLGRIRDMEKTAFWDGFHKQANAATELAGLGMLAAPSIQHLRGKPMKESTSHKLELAGLGTLAAPYAVQIGKKLLGKK